MKRTALMKQLKHLAKDNDVEFELLRQSGHEIWSFNGRSVAIPRHTEINEITARKIIQSCEEATR